MGWEGLEGILVFFIHFFFIERLFCSCLLGSFSILFLFYFDASACLSLRPWVKGKRKMEKAKDQCACLCVYVCVCLERREASER
jgi:hypothetical protein